MTAFQTSLPATQQLQQIINRSQYDLLPIIAGCQLGIVVLSLMRDLFTSAISFSIGLVAYNLVSFNLLVTIWCARQSERAPVEWSNTLGAVCLACVALNPIVQLLSGGQIGPLYFCTALFGGALTVLSVRHLVTVQAIVIVLWLAASILTLPLAKILPLLIMNLVAAGLGIVTLKKRLSSQDCMHLMAWRVATLESILPTCAGCNKACTDQGEWLDIHCYIEYKEQELLGNRSMCPMCMEQHYGEIISGFDLDPEAASKALAMKIN